MKVEILEDMTQYSSHFTKGAIGESNMKEFQYPDTPWNTYVHVTINGCRIPVNKKKMRCLDEEYNEIQRLLAKKEQQDLIQRLKKAESVYHVVGPRGGNRGVYIFEQGGKYAICLAGRTECAVTIKLCDEHQIAYNRVLDDEFAKIEREY